MKSGSKKWVKAISEMDSVRRIAGSVYRRLKLHADGV